MEVLVCFLALKNNRDTVMRLILAQSNKGLSILPVSSKQTVVSREFLELHSMTGTVETVFASSIARCDAF